MSYGVITEQGYPMGNGLGFKPLTEQENEAIKKQEEKKEENNK